MNLMKMMTKWCFPYYASCNFVISILRNTFQNMNFESKYSKRFLFFGDFHMESPGRHERTRLFLSCLVARSRSCSQFYYKIYQTDLS